VIDGQKVFSTHTILKGSSCQDIGCIPNISAT
jgi:hypothetical protein